MKQAVVLGGGGSRGSYQIGVWKALRELNYEISIVAGTSVGALNAAMMVQGDYDLSVQLWENLTTTDVVDLPKIKDKLEASTKIDFINGFLEKMIKEGGVDTTPLEDMLKQYLDEDKIRRSDMEFGLVTVEFPSMKPSVLTKENIPQGKLMDYLMASAACYPAMKGRVIDGKKYIDGGYYSNVPIEIAISAGAEHIVAVDLECIGKIRPANLRDSRIKYIRSHWDLGIFLLFDPVVAKRNMILGYNDCMKAFGKYDGKLYTFLKLEHLNLADYYDGCLNIAGAGYGNGYGFLSSIAQTCGRNITKTEKLSKQGCILACAEYGARVLGVNPEPVYTSLSFGNAVSEIAKKMPENAGELEAAIRSIRNISDAKVVLSSVEIGSVTRVLANMIRKAMDDNGIRRILITISKILPVEMASALTLIALER